LHRINCSSLWQKKWTSFFEWGIEGVVVVVVEKVARNGTSKIGSCRSQASSVGSVV